MKAQEFDRIVRKLELKIRDTHHRLAWLEHDGKVIVRTRRSHGSGDVPMEHAIRQQLKLSSDQLASLLGCTISREDYLGILREKGLL